MKKKWIATTMVMGGCAAALLGLSGCGTAKISLSDYVEVTFEGYDGYGTATADFDEEAFEAKYGKKLKLNDTADDWGYTSVAEVISDWYGYTVSPASDLCNGDEVTVECYDEDWCEASDFIDGKFEVSLDSATYEVSGLEEVTETDIFDDVSVTFSGTAPGVDAKITVKGNLSPSWFTLDQSSNLDVGDVVTVSVVDGCTEDIIEATGSVPAESYKKYEVDGVAHYASSLDEISEDAMDSMQGQAEDAFEAYAASGFSETEEVLSSDYIGSYLLSAKGGMNVSNNNMLYLVYKVTVKNESTDSFTYYRYCMFSDIKILKD
ncbi:MAG: hypothetical protein LIO96_04505 [Lachnospiraceae bacterium]|nr:hypothetical protein [Lachnospiraceae bacterium]